jgi:hypothetical protein
MHVEVFGPIAEERAGTSKSYCGVIKVSIILECTKTKSKGTLGSLTSLRDIPADGMAYRHSGRRGSSAKHVLLRSTRPRLARGARYNVSKLREGTLSGFRS